VVGGGGSGCTHPFELLLALGEWSGMPANMEQGDVTVGGGVAGACLCLRQPLVSEGPRFGLVTTTGDGGGASQMGEVELGILPVGEWLSAAMPVSSDENGHPPVRRLSFFFSRRIIAQIGRNTC